MTDNEEQGHLISQPKVDKTDSSITGDNDKLPEKESKVSHTSQVQVPPLANTSGEKHEDNTNTNNILDTLINEHVSFGWEHTKIIILLIIYITGEGFIMIGVSLIIPVIEKPWKLTHFEKGLIGGSVFMGFTVGALFSGEVTDKQGRKFAFLIGNLLSLSGGVIGVFQQEVYVFGLSNFLVGFGIGIGWPSLFSLCSEITNPKVRAYIYGFIFNCFVVGEIIGCHIALAQEMYHYDNMHWKNLLIIRCFFFILSLCLISRIIESPKFLLTKNRERDGEAFAIISSLLGEEKRHLLSEELKNRISEQYNNYMQNNDEKRNNYKDLLNVDNRKVSIILFIIWFIVSFVYYGLIYILPSVYQKLTLTKHNSKHVDANLYNMIIADIIFSCIFEIPSNITNGILPNIIGRRSTVALGFFGTGLCLLLCCVTPYSIPLYSSLAKGFINTAFNVLYTYTTEAYPTYMRATALGTCNFFSRIGGFSTPFICEFLIKIHFIFPFVIFWVTTVLGFILTLFLEETLGKTTY